MTKISEIAYLMSLFSLKIINIDRKEVKMLKINGKYFYKDDQRFFYLADTCWGAFTSVSMPDWRYYLDTRKKEGFNAIQINILRQYDSIQPLPGREPFPITYHKDGSYEYDYSKFNEDYFNNAEKMLKEMQKLDIISVLVLLWGNFVPNTWMNNPNCFLSQMSKPQVMPFEAISPYISYVVQRFKKYHPIYFVSGDVGFDKNDQQNPEVEEQYYEEVVNAAKRVDPEGIYTFHINGESMTLPDNLAKETQFFSFQSGHGPNGERAAVSIPISKREENYQGPIVDTEPCYEGLTQFGVNKPHRFSAYDIRRTAWKTVLSGADAGLGYGAFGIWPWNDRYSDNQQITGVLNPYDWRECLKFKGAKDLCFIKEILLQYAQDGLEPIEVKSQGIKVAASKGYWLIYNPVANPVDLSDLGLSDNKCKIIDLQTRELIEGKIQNNVVPMESVLEDELIIINR